MAGRRTCARRPPAGGASSSSVPPCGELGRDHGTAVGDVERRAAAVLAHAPVAVALVAAVSSWAANPAASTTPSHRSAPAAAAEQDFAPVQDTQTMPAPPGDEGPGERGPGGPGGPGDCPEKDGDGGGSGSAAPQSSAPDSAQTRL